MTDNAIKPSIPAGVPAPLPDDENPALIDAFKTFKITAISAALFCLGSLVIILMTRMG
ncbi:MAG: hypothetical protein O2826_12030 [Chloroflexi bacterium]|nr:hypothetical protein [Gemmatimonadota bacterium]MDA1175226.1 hypothetical protein [Chloroflexota bacterium]